MVHFVVLVAGENPDQLLYPYNDLSLFPIDFLEKNHLKEWCFMISKEDVEEEMERICKNTKNRLVELENKTEDEIEDEIEDYIMNLKNALKQLKIKIDPLELENEIKNLKDEKEKEISNLKKELEHMNELKDYPIDFFNQYGLIHFIEKSDDYYQINNPNGKFDWYIFGGRWSGFLKLKNGEFANAAYKSEVDWKWQSEKERYPFVLLTKKEWYTICEDGWCDKSEIPNMEGYKNGFWDRINQLPENTMISVFDCHE